MDPSRDAKISAPESSGLIPARWQMFILSFSALFLELMMIRWVPSVVRLVAYYANLMLLSSFLGLGLGALAAGRKGRLFGWFPIFLAANIGLLLLCRHLVLGVSGAEVRFFASSSQSVNYGILIGLFVCNALVFVPLGQQMGQLFNTLPRLSAYAWDLGGSLCGTICFGIFSLKHFSPALGMAGVGVLHLGLTPRRSWRWSVPVLGLGFAGMLFANDPATIWSPYFHILLRDSETNAVVSAPPAGLRTMRDPPVYHVSVNQDFYHYDASLDLNRYTPGTPKAQFVEGQLQQYGFPYALGGRRPKVLVVGAGGGPDVQAALKAGATSVDAVEIDPGVVEISRHFNADNPYDDPRVHIQVDDARAFFSRAPKDYDLVAFGFLDSQVLFSSMSNLRLDGFVYTVESIRAAYALLNDDGMLCLSFAANKPWLIIKLYRMVEAGTGRPPRLYIRENQLVLCVQRRDHPPPPLPTGSPFRLIALADNLRVDLPTDDWPYLYLKEKTIPSDYLIVMGSLLALSLAAVYALRGRSFGRSDSHFALLGMGFLLLETKSISDCSLYFGATWLVTLIVVAGVLLMVLAANFVAGRLPRSSPKLYLPLFAALLLCLVPREHVLALSLAGRLAWAILAVPLPVFFAGLIFSTQFREATNPAMLFGANLIGAMIGGFSEYAGMAVGSQLLSILVIVAYALSLLFLRSASGSGGIGPPANLRA